MTVSEFVKFFPKSNFEDECLRIRVFNSDYKYLETIVDKPVKTSDLVVNQLRAWTDFYDAPTIDIITSNK